ncbi:MAG: C40 family peptidase [Rhodanobacter sp.]|jgi:cell wall-associated NlpC family hydrolase|nr:C40 family peptidase [Rhodanobacter sp.]
MSSHRVTALFLLFFSTIFANSSFATQSSGSDPPAHHPAHAAQAHAAKVASVPRHPAATKAKAGAKTQHQPAQKLAASRGKHSTTAAHRTPSASRHPATAKAKARTKHRSSHAQSSDAALAEVVVLPTLDDAQTLISATAESEPANSSKHLRRLLAEFSMSLRDVRYQRGGSEPSTGFDCSGFVRYVFRHTAGSDLPRNSASQYLAGTEIDPSDMKTGDLVFFHVHGKRISHVGIYLGNGQFIHSPSTGKHVSISRLNEAYWARRFAGAKRPNVLS